MPEIKQSYYLQQALNFTDADLKANRAGRLTGKQLRLFLKEMLTLPAILFILVLAYIAVGSLFVVDTFIARMLIIVLSSPFLLTLVLILNGCLNFFDDLRKRDVLAETGVIYRSIKRGTRATSPQWRIRVGKDGILLDVPQDAYKNIVNHGIYTIYYLPRTKKLVSIEQADRETFIREIKDELKYLESQQASLKAKKGQALVFTGQRIG